MFDRVYFGSHFSRFGPYFQPLIEQGVVAKQSVKNPHGAEFVCWFLPDEEEQVNEYAGIDCLKVGTWTVVKTPELVQIATPTNLRLRLDTGELVCYDRYEDTLLTVNSSVQKFEECWQLFKTRVVKLRYCESKDDKLMPQWVDFQQEMLAIDPVAIDCNPVWAEAFGEGVFPW